MSESSRLSNQNEPTMEAEFSGQPSILCNLEIFDSIDDNFLSEIVYSWSAFCDLTDILIRGRSELSTDSEFVSHVHFLCKHGLQSLIEDHFLHVLQGTFHFSGVVQFCQHFEVYSSAAALMQEELRGFQPVLSEALEEVTTEKLYEEKCLLSLVHALSSFNGTASEEARGRQRADDRSFLSSKYQLMISSILLADLPIYFPAILHRYFKEALEELSMIVSEECEDGSGGPEERVDMEVDVQSRLYYRTSTDIDNHCGRNKLSENNTLVKNIGKVVHDLRCLGLTSMAEDAYGSAIFLLLKDKVHSFAGEDYRTSVLESVKKWIQAVPLQFFYALLSYLGDPVSNRDISTGMKSPPLASFPSSCYPGIHCPSEGLVRWQLRLEYFAYETLQDLRIDKLFDIIVDYPDSSPAIEDLKHCLEYTGQHSKLVASFVSALRYRLLTAGASTNDILQQYVSSIKALRTIDPAGVFLEVLGEPIKDYLRGRKDTIKCIVTMLTGGHATTATAGDGLLEELMNRDDEDRDVDDRAVDERQAWIDAQRWEPDPVEADPFRGGGNRGGRVDLLGMVVGIIGSKDQLIDEYRVMLAEKLLSRADYDIDADIRTVELLKIHFGEGSMHKCEVMLNDLIASKRLNTSIRQSIDVPEHVLDATVISSKFWPLIQEEPVRLPVSIEHLQSEYGRRFNEIKAPRKLVWKGNLGAVKLELEFEDRAVLFTVTPLLAAIIIQFEDQKSWTCKKLAAAVGAAEGTVRRRIGFWLTKGVISERICEESDGPVFTLEESKGGGGGGTSRMEDDDDEGGTAVKSPKDTMLDETTVQCMNFIMMMVRNMGSLKIEQIDNSLKMYYSAYDKSLDQLWTILSSLVSRGKLELNHGLYSLKR